jgi:hypothetical protein
MGKIKTVCYGREEIWESREEVETFFLQAMAGSEGSEQERYITIYTKLRLGMDICTDEN